MRFDPWKIPSYIAAVAVLVFGYAVYSVAQVVPQPGPPVPIACAYNSSPVTLTSGQAGWAQCTNAGALIVSTGGAGTQDVNVVTSATTASAVTSASSTAAGSNLVLKASAGNLYQLTVSIGATSGYLMLFDATALPSNGAVTPVFCRAVDSNGTNGALSIDFFPPKPFATGITAGFSTTGCFSLTASTTASFFGGYK